MARRHGGFIHRRKKETTMKSAWKYCLFLSLATALLAQNSTPAKTTRKAKAPAVTAADVQALKDAIAAQQSAIAQQQQQIQQLRDELRQKDQAVQQAQSSASDAASKATAAESQASQQQEAVNALKSDVGDMKTNMTNTVMTLQEVQKTVSEPPTALHVKGITITPGGFLAAESVYRTRALGADINTPFNSTPMPGSSNAGMSEFFGSGRQSRVSMLAEGKTGMAKFSGYVEADFLSAGVTSNNNQSNSYTLRQRQVWGQAALNSGWSFTAGQQWSLITETKVGMDNRTEALPMTIDPQYHVGFSWARQYGFRVVKNVNNKVWFGLAVENPQATLTSHGNASNFLLGSAGTLGGLYNNQANYAFNPSPDLIAKVVFEPGFRHYEVFGVYSRFRDRIFPCEDVASTDLCGGSTTAGPNALGAFNSSKNGGGFGANARWSFAKKHVDVGVHGMGGSGVGRYGTTGLADTAVRADGSLYLVKSLQGLATLEFHYPKIDIYFNTGAEYAGRAASFDPVSGKVVGYGAPSFNNSGCFIETGPGSGGFAPGSLSNCTADTRVMIEGTAGFWHKIHSSPKGRLQWGLQYSYIDRQAWAGAGGEPHGLDSMVFSSFRYYLP
jgi:Skp family chaperone for outer membrane proteins